MMTVDFETHLQTLVAKGATEIVERLQGAGYQALIVGGAVRDLLLGREPKDYDIATSATPEEVKHLFKKRARIIGRRFRLVHTHLYGFIYEVSTFRREPTEEERKGRPDDDGIMVWRDNAYGTLEQDAWRRDFTVNALYLDPLHPEEGIKDFVNGLSDIQARKVRIIGNTKIRLYEDPVRVLRALKLIGQYDFSLESELASVIPQVIPKIQLASKLRLLEEFFKILRRPWSQPTFSTFYEYGLLPYFLPKLHEYRESSWGQELWDLLKTRDRLIAEEKIFPSRITGVATMLVPFLRNSFGNHDSHPFWENFNGIDGFLQQLIRDFLTPYPVPRHIVAKIRDVLLLIPKLVLGKNRKRILRHPEYARSRDFLVLLTEHYHCDQRMLDSWPKVDYGAKRGDME